MLKLTEATIENISDRLVDYIKSQGKLLPKTPKAGGGSNKNEVMANVWYNYIKRVDPHEKKYIIIMKNLLTKQANEVFGNIIKYPNRPKKWTFNKKKWLGLFADAEAKFIVKLIKQEGQKAIDLALKLARRKSYHKANDMPVSIAFDVYNPEVTERLLDQTARFPAGLVNTTEEIIRREIANGLELGESIDKLRKRVEARLGESFIKNRAENISRSETIYASNAGAELGYMQSGVCEGKKWLVADDERLCDYCRPMDGRTAPLGDTFDIKDIELNFDYSKGEMPHPPLHPRCRCTIIPIIETVERFKPAKSIKEAEDYATRFADIVSYKGLDINSANSINKYFDEMFNEYKFKPIKIIQAKKMGYASGYAEFRVERIAFSTNLNGKYYQEGLSKYYDKGFLSGGKLNNIDEIFQRLVNHEMTHIQFNKIMSDQKLVFKMADTKKTYIAALKKAKKLNNMKLYNEIHISDYAKTNVNEFAAEAFNDYRFSKKPSMYAKQAYDIILEAMKNR